MMSRSTRLYDKSVAAKQARCRGDVCYASISALLPLYAVSVYAMLLLLRFYALRFCAAYIFLLLF